MNIRLTMLLLCFAAVAAAQKQYQLAAPMLHFSSEFFNGKTSVSISFREPGTIIRYTTDGSEPTETSQAYASPVIISNGNTTIRARVFGKNFLPSDAVSATFYTTGIAVKQITTTPPNSKYAGNGAALLHDGKSGSSNFSDGLWLGYDSDSIVLDVTLEKTTAIHQIMIHALSSQSSWIFLPEAINVYGLQHGHQTKLSSIKPNTINKRADGSAAISIPINSNANQFRIVLYPVMHMPDWHDGKGSKAWIFIDEITVE